jgi:hypothetical protein
MPEWSLTVFVFNMSLILLGTILSAYWYKKIPESRRVDLLSSFVMFFLTGFFLITPILRLTIDTSAFWFFLLSYLMFIIYLLFKNSSITPDQRRVSKFIPSLVLVLFISGFFLRNSGGSIISQVYSQNQAAVVFGVILSLVGFIFTLMSFTFIKITFHSR